MSLDVAILLVGSYESVHVAVCDSTLWPTAGNQIRRRGPIQETRFSAVATTGNQIQCCGHSKETDSTQWPAAGIRSSTFANSRKSGSVPLSTAEKEI
jgi:hypothetical protein